MLDPSVPGGADTPPRPPREPKYWGLKQHLLDRVRSLPAGSPIPTERALATEFDVSRTTVRQALAELTVEGRLLRVQGKGTFVAAPKVAQPLQLTSYTQDTLSQGRRPASRVLDVVEERADEQLGGLLGVGADGLVLRMRRLRLADGEAMAIETTHLPLPRFHGLGALLAAGGSLYQLMQEQFDIELGHADETIETALATPEETELLGADTGLPMLLLSRHAFDASGKPVEWVRALYRGDRYKFVARLDPPRG